ncbi:MAG: hypothetical protein WCB04_11880 [Mycobacteriales bacterium]
MSLKAATWTPSIATSGTDKSVEQVRQLVPCGGNMYAVGLFSALKKGSTTYQRNNVASFSATTGAMTSWAPNVNGRVDTIAFNGSDCSSAYIGGVFTTVSGSAARNIARVSTTTGAVDQSFLHTMSGRVTHMEVMKGHLLVGGYFAGYLKSLSPATGLPDGYAMPVISGNYQFPGVGSNPTRIWNMTPSPNGSAVLMMGDFTSVGGKPRRQIFRLNLGTTATVSNWYSDGNPLDPKYKDGFNEDCATVEPFWLQDAAWSPDMSKIYVATTGYKPWDSSRTAPRTELCDAAAAFSSLETDVDPLWINYTGCDSLFSVAADATTVYVGGHERWANNPLGCDAKGPGAIVAPGMVGLSPVNGSVVWNPGRGRGLGADDMVVTGAGLWIGSDNLNNTSSCAGSSARAGICFVPN